MTTLELSVVLGLVVAIAGFASAFGGVRAALHRTEKQVEWMANLVIDHGHALAGHDARIENLERDVTAGPMLGRGPR